MFIDPTHRHRSVRLNIALICSEWEALRRRELSPKETTTQSPAKEDEVLPVPNPDFDYSLPSLGGDDVDKADPNKLPAANPDFDYSLPSLGGDGDQDDSNKFPTANPDFDYSLPSSVALEEDSADNSNPIPTPNPDFDYSLPVLP